MEESDEEEEERESWGATSGRRGEKSSRKFNSGLWARDPGRPRKSPAGVGGIAGSVPPGDGGRAVTHRAAAAVLLMAPAIQLRRCAPPRVCPARPGSPAPNPQPPPARGHVTRDLSGTRHAAGLGERLSGCASVFAAIGDSGG